MPTTELFVGNLPYSTTEQDLRELFERSGTRVAAVRIITDLDTGRSKGYAFVQVSTSDEAEKALRELHNVNLGGRTIVVSEARSRQGGRGRPKGPPGER